MTARDQIKAIVERIERIEEEIKARNEDKRDIYAEAKSNGFDVLALKAVVARRRKDPEKVAEQEAIIETYLAALGMVPATRAGARPEPQPAAPDRPRELPSPPSGNVSTSPANGDDLDIPDYLRRSLPERATA